MRFVTLYGVKNIFSVQDTVREQCLIAFVIYCAEQLKISYTSIVSYLCAIKFYFTRHSNVPDALASKSGVPFAKLNLVLKGIKKTRSAPTGKRAPITVDLLDAMVRVLAKGYFGSYLDSMLQTVFLVAFFGFMRCGEFTCKTDHFDYNNGLALADVKLNMAHKDLSITLRSSKTDHCKKGVTIRLYPQRKQILCPVQAVDRYMLHRSVISRNPKGPFFIMPSGGPLTRSEFIALLQSVLQHLGRARQDIKPHSFRIGAATSAAAAQVPDYLIKVLGRWSSDSYQRYIRTSSVVVAAAQTDMGNLVTSATSHWQV